MNIYQDFINLHTPDQLFGVGVFCLAFIVTYVGLCAVGAFKNTYLSTEPEYLGAFNDPKYNYREKKNGEFPCIDCYNRTCKENENDVCVCVFFMENYNLVCTMQITEKGA